MKMEVGISNKIYKSFGDLESVKLVCSYVLVTYLEVVDGNRVILVVYYS